jgi:cell division protein FtsB
MRKFITLIIIGILLLLNLNFIQGSYQSFQKLSEINDEHLKVKELEAKNTELKEELKDHDSTYFIEQEARNRLGFSRPGETTIVIESSEITEAAHENIEKQKSNLQSWLELVKLN